MRPLRTLFPLLLAACAAPATLVRTADDRARSPADAAAELAAADVVVLGEQHGVAAVHRLHLELLRHLHARRPDLTIAMEMFDRDVQNHLLAYLAGLTAEAEFLAAARPWRGYATDYRPVVEFAKEQRLVVLAANAPHALAVSASRQGVASVLGDPHVARQTEAPEDEYWDAFVDSMRAHVGVDGDAAMQRHYAAQCLKDDTMAETVVDHLRAQLARGRRPLVVLIVGQFHSDHRRGAVARIVQRMPELDVRTVSAEAVADLDAGLYGASRSVADYVVVVEQPPAAAVPPPLPQPRQPAAPAAPTAPGGPAVATERQAPAAGAATDPEGPRPGLGIRPDYNAPAVVVDSVRAGGPADLAGIEPGDVILELAGRPVADMESYVAVLGGLRIGRKVPVRVRRGEAEVVLQVLVAESLR